MKLYYAPGTCSTAVHIVLEMIGEPYELERVETGSEAFKKVSPIGAVPAFIDGDSGVMTQGDAILKYLARKFPQANLGTAPEPLAEYRLDNWLAFLTGDLHPAFWPVFSPQKYTEDQSEAGLQQVRDLARGSLHRFYQYLDNHLQGKQFIVDDRLTIADPYAYVMLRWTRFTVLSLEDYPNIEQFYNRIDQLEATQKALSMQAEDK